MKPTVKKYRSQIIIVLLLFACITSVTLLIKEYKANDELKKSSQQLNNTVSKRMLPAINKQRESVQATIQKPFTDSARNRGWKEKEKSVSIKANYNDSLLHALNFYMNEAAKLTLENTILKQQNASLVTVAMNSSDTVLKQKKIIAANGSYKDDKLTAHLKQTNKFDNEGNLIYDSSNFKYDYKKDSLIAPQAEVVKRKVPGLPFKQEEIQIRNGNLSFSLKQPFMTLQPQILFNSSYRLKGFNDAPRIGVNIGAGLQANTLGINARVAGFYNATQISGSFWQRSTIALQLQKPLWTFKIK